MALDEYRRKRKFSRTPEPAPAEAASAPALAAAKRFYIQRHSARRLHYDLRLEMDGALRSWAVPKGPTLDPKEKRMAVLVEDHPLEYGEFEGTIPEGNYGAGAVMLWDRGTYEWLTEKSPQEMWDRGDLKFRLHGEKLMGEFALVRLKKEGKPTRDWLLLKKPDFAAQPGWNSEDHLESVARGAVDPANVPGAMKAAMPRDLAPMLACPTRALPEGAAWVYEVKWDGYRCLAFLNDGKARLRSRRGITLHDRFPELAGIAPHFAAKQAIVDGEIVALDAEGRPSFGALQGRMGMSDVKVPASAIVLFAFDLVYLDGYDLRRVPLVERKRLLHAIIKPNPSVRYSEHFASRGKELLEAARAQGLEGVMAKRATSPYEDGRRSDCWLKVKFVREQDFVICGWLEGERSGFGSLVLGLYDSPAEMDHAPSRARSKVETRHAASRSAPAPQLVWVGNAGSGFTDSLVTSLQRTLKPLERKQPLFSPVPNELRDAHWVEPQLVASVKFSSWTHENRLRAPVFLRLNPDADPRDCVREDPDTATARVDAGDSPAPPAKRATETSDVAPASGRQTETPALQLPEKQNEVITTVGAQRLKFTNLNKVFWPREGYTKRDLINYYAAASSFILPHLKDRPLSLKRYPNGIESEYFFQKNTPETYPKWIHTEPVETDPGKFTRFVLADDEAALLYLANLGCIDQNPWMSRIGTLHHPDYVLIDLDPVNCQYDRIVEAAQLVRAKLELMSLAGYPKTTGGDGMHIYIPVVPRYSYEQVRTFAEIIARMVVHERPDLFTTPRTVAKREKGKVYFDYLQISEGKTISAPYVPRAYGGAPVSTPLTWSEVQRGLSPAQFTIVNAIDRFARVGDLFAGVLDKPQELEPALARLEGLVKSAHT